MFKFIIAFIVGKITKVGLKLFHKRATHFPGKLARKICPDFLKYISKPANIICVTGTNGKTSTSNMIEDALRMDGVKLLDNNFGSNTLSGICTVFIDGVTAFNKAKYNTYVLEIDERSSPHIYKHITPTYFICTNLFRDSIMRNAHTEYIFDIINNWLPKETKLILNGDDLISSRLGKGKNENRVFFGIDKLDGEEEEHNIINDARTCPECGSKMIFDFRRYHHIGRAHCSLCTMKSPEIDYRVTAADMDNRTITMKFGGKSYAFPMISETIFNIYNEAAVIALLTEYGYDDKKTADMMAKLHITETRHSEVEYGNVKINSTMLKGLNPVACSRNCNTARTTKGKKSIFFMVDDIHNEKNDSENVAWYYESDLEFLNDESIKNIYIAGPRSYDMKYRLLLAGIDESKIKTADNGVSAVKLFNFTYIDTFFIFYDMFRFDELEQKIKPAIKKMLTKEAE